MNWKATRLPQERPRLRLSPEDYDLLRKQVLERDGWRCQSCGSLKNLQVHHVRKRSQLGDDLLDNLITLCISCHATEHRPG
jgi:5-methylcytosine-specific restriction endonuclease McrA